MHYHGPANAADPRNAKVAKLADAPDLGTVFLDVGRLQGVAQNCSGS